VFRNSNKHPVKGMFCNTTHKRPGEHTHTHVRKIGAEKQSKKCVKRKNISQTGLGENAHTTANSSKKRKLQLKNAHARASRNL